MPANRRFPWIVTICNCLGRHGGRKSPVCCGEAAHTLAVAALGVWSLINAVSLTDGVLNPWFGRTPPITGILIYLDNGWMSVQIAGARPGKNPANFDDLPADDRTKGLG